MWLSMADIKGILFSSIISLKLYFILCHLLIPILVFFYLLGEYILKCWLSVFKYVFLLVVDEWG
jgi:hypothetical protein